VKQKWILSSLAVWLLAGLGAWLVIGTTFKEPVTEKGTHQAADEPAVMAENSAAASEPDRPEAHHSMHSHNNAPEPSQVADMLLLSDIPAGEFKRGLAELVPSDRQQVLQKLSENRQLLSDVASIRVDESGMIYYVCTFHDGHGMPPSAAGDAPAEEEAVTGGGTVPISSPPILHSRPGAPNVLFLDFNGHVIEGTAWNNSRGVASWNCRPYDKDGDETTFNDAELAAISQAWERVAEDFSPFDVDVTTEEPAEWGPNTGHALITPGIDANGVACPHDGYGGIAYVDVFGGFRYSYNYAGNSYSPAWCIDYDADDVAEVISHELGHNLALSHDKWSDGTVTNGYYSGHGNGGISWGPIMGTGYNDDVSQWSKGDYLHAYNSSQDDLAIIADLLSYRPDDHGDNPDSAAPLSPGAAGLYVGSGVIETTGDPDYFSFAAQDGSVEILAETYRASSGTWGGNLDIKLSLCDGTGTLLATNNPALETKASISTNLVAGTYYVRIEPTGAGDPLVDPPTGYTLYSTLGQYDVSIIPPGGLTILDDLEGFEAGSYALWQQSNDDDIDWSSGEESTPSGSTGPSGASAGRVYLYTEASSPNYPGKVAKLDSIRLNLEAAVPGLSFDYHMYGAKMGMLAVDVYDGTWHLDVWSRTGQQHAGETNGWTSAHVDLTAYAGKRDVVLRLRGTTGSGYTSDMAIDNIRLSYDIDSDGLPDSWELEYFGSATGAVAAADSDQDGFSNLAECVSGHDPTNAASFFRIISQSAMNVTGAPFIVNWEPMFGRVYGVLWSDSLPGGFTNISGDIPYPTGSYTDTVQRAGQEHFYRIEVRTEP
jgi:hypothetical protein